MLKMSTLFLRTLRDDPADAEVASHRLLVRAGYIRRIAAGIYSWLPLGVITLRNVENVIRQEMDQAGFQEVHFPALLPREASLGRIRAFIISIARSKRWRLLTWTNPRRNVYFDGQR